MLRQILSSVISGYEIGGRIGEVYRILPGIHVDGTWGTFAAVAGIARLLNLSAETTKAAIDIAACQLPLSLYHPIRHGSTLRNMYVGHGAMLAHYAVTAAQAGIAGAPGGLAEHMRLLHGKAPDELPHPIAEGSWLIDEGYLKKYPVVKHVHYGIEAALRWRQAGQQIGPGDLITLRIYGDAMTYCGNRDPRSSIAAQFSLSWGLAWALLKGGLTTAALMPEGLANQEVRALEARIVIEEDRERTATSSRGATLIIEKPDRVLRPVDVVGVPGDPRSPLSRDEVVAKFVAGAAPVIDAG